jgi:hypothetical protein
MTGPLTLQVLFSSFGPRPRSPQRPASICTIMLVAAAMVEAAQKRLPEVFIASSGCRLEGNMFPTLGLRRVASRVEAGHHARASCAVEVATAPLPVGCLPDEPVPCIQGCAAGAAGAAGADCGDSRESDQRGPSRSFLADHDPLYLFLF